MFCFVVFVVSCCSSSLKWRNSLRSQYSYEVFALNGFYEFCVFWSGG